MKIQGLCVHTRVCMLILALYILVLLCWVPGLPRWLIGKESTSQCRRLRNGFNSRFGKIPGGGNGNPLPYSCLDNPMDREAWWATVHGVMKSHMTVRLNVHTSCRCFSVYKILYPLTGLNLLFL